MSLSPDATVIATAGEDGHVKFWKVNNDSAPEYACLHDLVLLINYSLGVSMTTYLMMGVA